MFKAVSLGAVALVGAWSPLGAQVVSISINGAVTGTQSTVMCAPGSGASCLASYPSGTVSEAFLKTFDLSIFPNELAQGDTSFSYGFARSTGLWSGIINNSEGVLTGHDLTYAYEDSSCRTGAVGCHFAFASASSFNVLSASSLNVLSAVPEPETWATMLLGFLAIGMAIRMNPRLTPRLSAR